VLDLEMVEEMGIARRFLGEIEGLFGSRVNL